MKIIETRWCEIVVEDENRYRSTVVRLGDGRWRCIRCGRYRCEHAKFALRQKLELPPPPQLSAADDDILTY